MTQRGTIKTLLGRHLSPEQIFIFGFVAYILLGAFLLWFPFSAATGRLRFVDAAFAATSAVCVTGLAPLDIGKDLSFVGQVITIFLFQVGGLGIITFSPLFFVLMGKGISFKGREKVARSLPSPNGIDDLPVSGDFTICEIAPPAGFWGKSIGDLHLCKKHHLEVIAVRDVLSDKIKMVPQAGFVIKDSDVLVVIGKERDIQKLK